MTLLFINLAIEIVILERKNRLAGGGLITGYSTITTMNNDSGKQQSVTLPQSLDKPAD